MKDFDIKTSIELLSQLSQSSRCLDELVVEMNSVPLYDPYDPCHWNGDIRTTYDVGMDIDYNLWLTQKAVKKLCEIFNVKVD